MTDVTAAVPGLNAGVPVDADWTYSFAAPETTPGPLLVDPDWARDNPEDANARVLRYNHRDFRNRFLPHEIELLQRLSPEAAAIEKETAANEIRTLVATQDTVANDSLNRQLRRRGISLTADQQQTQDRLRGLNTALSDTTGRNLVRRNIEDRRVNALSDAISIGRGIRTSSQNSLGAAAELQSAREDAEDAARRQREQGRWGAAAAGAGLGAAVGGPYGAAVGFAAGYFLG